MPPCRIQNNENDTGVRDDAFLMDFDSRALLNGKLVGRERQLQEISQKYHRRRQRQYLQPPELVLITGQSGTGKTLLATFLEPIVKRDSGYFLSGKCDPDNYHQQQHTPFAPFVKAFSLFVEQVLSRGEDAIEQVRQALQDEHEAELMLDIFPDFQKLLKPTTTTHGDGCPKEFSKHEERKHRIVQFPDVGSNPYVSTVTKFLIRFCNGSQWNAETGRSTTLIVLVLDGIQWIDQASLHLLGALVVDRTIASHVNFIATCRGSEVDVESPLAATLRELEGSLGVHIVDVPLQNLTKDEMDGAMADMLDVPREDIFSLASLAHEHTKGNPFSLLQLLRAMCEKKLLYSVASARKNGSTGGSKDDNLERKWVWDIEGIKMVLSNLNVRDVDMLSSRIEHVAEECDVVQNVLKIIACMGNEFNVSHVETVVKNGKTRCNVRSALSVLAGKRLIYATNGAEDCSVYCWAHDRYHRAAYNVVPDNERTALHKKIGLGLLHNLSPSELEHSVFLVVDQLARVDPMLLERGEKNELVWLCLMAGRKQAQASAFQSASHYLNLGIFYLNIDVGLLEESRWVHRYDLKLSLYNAAAEMECCNGNSAEVDILVGHIFDHARCFEDKIRAYETQIYSLCARQDLSEAINVGLYVLKRLGEPFSFTGVDQRQTWREIQHCRRLLKKKSDEDILKLRPLCDWKAVNAVRIIQLLFPPIMQSQPHLGALFATRVIRLSFQHGLTPMASASFAFFGTILCYPMYGLYNEGNRYAQLGLKIMVKFHATELKCRIYHYLDAFCTPYMLPTRECIHNLTLGAQAGFASGDIEMSCSNLFLVCVGAILIGDPLWHIRRLLDKYRHRAAQLKQEKDYAMISYTLQVVLNLLGHEDNPLDVSGEACNEEEVVRMFEANGNFTAVRSLKLFKCFLAVYLSEYTVARNLSLEIQDLNSEGMNALFIPQMIFLGAMADVASKKSSHWQPLQAGRTSLKKLRIFSRLCPEKILNKVYLIEAERCVIYGQRDRAISKFQKSINHARDQGLIQEQALACERTGIRLLEWGKKPEALEYLGESRNLYRRWGSTYKADRITASYFRYTRAENIVTKNERR